MVGDVYGQYEPMLQSNCFFNMNNSNLKLNILIFFYIPIWSAIIINSILIALVVRELQSVFEKSGLEQMRGVYNLFTYPLILLVCWGLVSILHNLSQGS